MALHVRGAFFVSIRDAGNGSPTGLRRSTRWGAPKMEAATTLPRNAEHLTFRASPALKAALHEKADRAGCSPSEYLRSILREKVGLQ